LEVRKRSVRRSNLLQASVRCGEGLGALDPAPAAAPTTAPTTTTKHGHKCISRHGDVADVVVHRRRRPIINDASRRRRIRSFPGRLAVPNERSLGRPRRRRRRNQQHCCSIVRQVERPYNYFFFVVAAAAAAVPVPGVIIFGTKRPVGNDGKVVGERRRDGHDEPSLGFGVSIKEQIAPVRVRGTRPAAAAAAIAAIPIAALGGGLSIAATATAAVAPKVRRVSLPHLGGGGLGRDWRNDSHQPVVVVPNKVRRCQCYHGRVQRAEGDADGGVGDPIPRKSHPAAVPHSAAAISNAEWNRRNWPVASPVGRCGVRVAHAGDGNAPERHQPRPRGTTAAKRGAERKQPRRRRRRSGRGRGGRRRRVSRRRGGRGGGRELRELAQRRGRVVDLVVLQPPRERVLLRGRRGVHPGRLQPDGPQFDRPLLRLRARHGSRCGDAHGGFIDGRAAGDCGIGRRNAVRAHPRKVRPIVSLFQFPYVLAP
jgi:hypothetical protein